MTDWKKSISNWGTPAMAVYATELVCTKCHKDMGAVIFAKEESSNSFTQSDNDFLCQSCFEELKKAVRDSAMRIILIHMITYLVSTVGCRFSPFEEWRYRCSCYCIYYRRGEYDAALDKHNESLEISRQLDDKGGIAMSLNNIGLILIIRGKYEEALPHILQAHNILQRLHSPEAEFAVNNLTSIKNALGEEKYEKLVTNANRQ